MKDNKPFILFIDGSQSVGKSSITKVLREKLGSTTLLDLSGVKDKTLEGKDKTYRYHKKILQMLEETHECQMNYVISRSYQSEVVYCNLGYKPYTFDTQANSLISEIQYLTKFYNVYFIILTATEEQFKERLKRNKFCYNEFSVKNSLEQQEEYKKALRYLSKETRNVRCFEIPTNYEINDVVDIIVNSILTNMIGD